MLGLAAGACAPAQVTSESLAARSGKGQGSLGSQRPKEAFLQWGDFKVGGQNYNYVGKGLSEWRALFEEDELLLQHPLLSSWSLELLDEASKASCGFTDNPKDRQGFRGGFEVTKDSLLLTYDSRECVNPGGLGRQRSVVFVSCAGGDFASLKGRSLADAWNAAEQAQLGLGACAQATTLLSFENTVLDRKESNSVILSAWMTSSGAPCHFERGSADQPWTISSCRAGVVQKDPQADGVPTKVYAALQGDYTGVMFPKQLGQPFALGSVRLDFFPGFQAEVTFKGSGQAPLVRHEVIRAPIELKDTIALH
jgi:hypothetical protein